MSDDFFFSALDDQLEALRLEDEDESRVLVFPPELSSHVRFRIHDRIQSVHATRFSTFSVGQAPSRRLVVVAPKTMTQSDQNEDEETETSLEEEIRRRSGLNNFALRFAATDVDWNAFGRGRRGRNELLWGGPRPAQDSVVEIFDLDASVKTSDLTAAFTKSGFRNKYEIKWVDDNRAIVVFVTVDWAKKALKSTF